MTFSIGTRLEADLGHRAGAGVGNESGHGKCRAVMEIPCGNKWGPDVDDAGFPTHGEETPRTMLISGSVGPEWFSPSSRAVGWAIS